jgi:hypothetical protein
MSGAEGSGAEGAKKAGPLTERQRRFIEEYLLDLNATAAYRRAGYVARNDNTAAAGASTLLRNPKVAAAVAEAQQERADRAELTQDWVVGRLRHESQLTGEDASHSARVAALKLLGLHLGMFPKKHEVKGTVGLQVVEEVVGADGPAQDGEDAPRPGGVPPQ